MSRDDWRTEKELLRRFVQKDVRRNAQQAVSRRFSAFDWFVLVTSELIGLAVLVCIYRSIGSAATEMNAVGRIVFYGIVPFALLIVVPLRGLIAFRIARFRNHTEIDAIKRAGQWIHHRDD